jgi:hypothetical protein
MFMGSRYGWPEALSDRATVFNLLIESERGSTINTHRRYIIFRNINKKFGRMKETKMKRGWILKYGKS